MMLLLSRIGRTLPRDDTWPDGQWQVITSHSLQAHLERICHWLIICIPSCFGKDGQLVLEVGSKLFDTLLSLPRFLSISPDLSLRTSPLPPLHGLWQPCAEQQRG